MPIARAIRAFAMPLALAQVVLLWTGMPTWIASRLDNIRIVPGTVKIFPIARARLNRWGRRWAG